MRRNDRELHTVKLMLQIYCKGVHGHENLCSECRSLLEYAGQRIENCPMGSGKRSCRLCHIHCYKADMREQMRQAMRYAGPKMMLRHPVAAMRHIYNEFIRPTIIRQRPD